MKKHHFQDEKGGKFVLFLGGGGKNLSARRGMGS